MPEKPATRSAAFCEVLVLEGASVVSAAIVLCDTPRACRQETGQLLHPMRAQDPAYWEEVLPWLSGFFWAR